MCATGTPIARSSSRPSSAFSDLGIETVVVDRPVPPKSGLAFYGRLAANLVSPLPYSDASHRSVALDRAIRDLAARDQVDLWQAEWTPLRPRCKISRIPGG